MKVVMKGTDLRSVLRRSLDLPERSGGKLQTYGIRYEIVNQELSLKEIGQKNFNPDDYYSVALTDFLFAGGDGYKDFALKARTVYPDGLPLNQIFSDYIRNNKQITTSLIDSSN
jgi:5'-nucleotidase